MGNCYRIGDQPTNTYLEYATNKAMETGIIVNVKFQTMLDMNAGFYSL